jgi:hypothetical protein
MRKQVEVWQRSELTDVTAKVVIYEVFVEGRLDAPKHLARAVHDLYFEPKYDEFRPRTVWSLSNAFTSAFKELEPIPQFKATAKLGEFLEARFSQSFQQAGRYQRAALFRLASVARRIDVPPTDFPESRFWIVSGWPTIRELTLACAHRGNTAALPEASDNPAL